MKSDRAGIVKPKTYWALQTPSGIRIPMGSQKPKLTAQDTREFWKVIRIKRILAR